MTQRAATAVTLVVLSQMFIGIANIFFLGIYHGYFTNTVYKVGSSVMQVASTLVVIVAGIIIDSLMFRVLFIVVFILHIPVPGMSDQERNPISFQRQSSRLKR